MKIKQNEVQSYLTHMAKSHPRIVTDRLVEGSRVFKTPVNDYEVDNAQIHRDLGVFSPDQIPAGPIFRRSRPDQSEILRVLNGTKVFPFSKMYELGLGECLEKSVVMQLAVQDNFPSFLVNGILEQDNMIGAQAHAYNVILPRGNPLLLDVQNPWSVSGDKVQPYLIPITGIENDAFVVPEGCRLGRTYSLI